MTSAGQDKIVLKHRSMGAVQLFLVRRSLQLCHLLITAVISLTGCTKVGPDYIRPEVAVSQNWIVEDRGGLGLIELKRATDELVGSGNAGSNLRGLATTFSVSSPQL